MDIESIDFCDKKWLTINDKRCDMNSFGKHLVVECTDGTKYYISHFGNNFKRLEYRFYINNRRNQLQNIDTQRNLMECIIRYQVEANEYILYPIEYGPYISVNSIHCKDSCFLMGIGINNRQMNDFVNRFRESRNESGSDKNFFSIILHSDPYTNENKEEIEGHVSTLIVNCSENNPRFYLLDTSVNSHQTPDKTIEAGVLQITNWENVICLSSIPNEGLQNGNCCTVWATVISTKLARHNDINDVLDIQHNCLRSAFLQEIKDGVQGIRATFVNEQACENLMQHILQIEGNQQLQQQQEQQPIVQQVYQILPQDGQQEINNNNQQIDTSTVGFDLIEKRKSERQYNTVQKEPVQQQNKPIQIKDPNLTDKEREHLNNTFHNIRDNIALDIVMAKHTNTKETQQNAKEQSIL